MVPLSEIAFTQIQNNSKNPTIIFLHDSLGSIDLWRDFPQRLGELTAYNIIAYDRIGYGKSPKFSDPARDNAYIEHEADVLNQLIDHWQLDQVILFGHSDGGSIALIAAAKYPEKIMAIITEGAHIFVEDVTVNGIKEAIESYRKTDLKTKLSKYHGDKTEEMFWAWAKTWTSAEFQSWTIEKFLPFVQCPALIIQGKDDEFGTLKQVDGIVSQINGKTSKLVIAKIKHMPHKEIPELILEKTAAFIKAI